MAQEYIGTTPVAAAGADDGARVERPLNPRDVEGSRKQKGLERRDVYQQGVGEKGWAQKRAPQQSPPAPPAAVFPQQYGAAAYAQQSSA